MDHIHQDWNSGIRGYDDTFWLDSKGWSISALKPVSGWKNRILDFRQSLTLALNPVFGQNSDVKLWLYSSQFVPNEYCVVSSQS